MADRITVALLARELGVKPNDVMSHTRDLGFARVRVAASLSPGEADQVRTLVKNRRAAAAKRQAVLASRPSVADTRPPTVVATDLCHCCGLEVLAGTRHCSICEDHFYLAGESSQRRDDRLADHHRRVSAARSPSADLVAEYRDKVRSALRTRDNWRAALVEVMVHHEATDEGCLCGAAHYPCPSVETLERVNRGIARQVESYLSMPVDEMKEALYGEDSWLDLLGDVS